jgi:hypothetical protein
MPNIALSDFHSNSKISRKQQFGTETAAQVMRIINTSVKIYHFQWKYCDTPVNKHLHAASGTHHVLMWCKTARYRIVRRPTSLVRAWVRTKVNYCYKMHCWQLFGGDKWVLITKWTGQYRQETEAWVPNTRDQPPSFKELWIANKNKTQCWPF